MLRNEQSVVMAPRRLLSRQFRVGGHRLPDIPLDGARHCFSRHLAVLCFAMWFCLHLSAMASLAAQFVWGSVHP